MRDWQFHFTRERLRGARPEDRNAAKHDPQPGGLLLDCCAITCCTPLRSGVRWVTVKSLDLDNEQCRFGSMVGRKTMRGGADAVYCLENNQSSRGSRTVLYVYWRRRGRGADRRLDDQRGRR
jgi:hypothetical protein